MISSRPNKFKPHLPTGRPFGSLPVDMKQELDSIEAVLGDVRKGRMVVVVDDPGREKCGN
jgi:hypothetical protein